MTATAVILSKFGVTPEDIRFRQGNWILIQPPEGHEGLDCVHGCDQQKHVQWSYCLPGDPDCPGCGEAMPDDIQGLWQMANMDGPGRFHKEYWEQQIERLIEEKLKAFEQMMFSTGVGYVNKLTGITSE